MEYEIECQVALAAVRRACQLTEAVRLQLDEPAVLVKDDRSPATVADFAAQAVISKHLAEAFPDDPVVGEEDAHVLRQPANGSLFGRIVAAVRHVMPEMTASAVLESIDRAHPDIATASRYWSLDPVDGTRGFIRGDQYAVALALVENGQVVLGVLGCPRLPVANLQADGPKGCLFVARRGAGSRQCSLADLTEQAIRVTDCTRPNQAVLCESVEETSCDLERSLRVAAALDLHAAPVRLDSQCKYAVLARGDASIYLRVPIHPDRREKTWDHAAGVLLLTEAGGQVSDMLGRPIDFGSPWFLQRAAGIVATNGRLHSAVLAALQRTGSLPESTRGLGRSVGPATRR